MSYEFPHSNAFLPPHCRRVVVSLNPIAGARSARPRVDRLVQLLAREGFCADVHTDLGEAANTANRLHAEGRLRALVGVGGDGTAAELVNRTADGLPITLLPSGNENLLAAHLKLAGSPEALCRTISDGAMLRLDAGRAGRRIFLLMIGCGFDAEVVRRVHARRSGHIRSRNYLKPIVETVRSYEYPPLHVYWEDDPAGTLAVRWLFAFNLPCYGGGLRLAPGADGSDGLLDVCAFRRGSLWRGLWYAGAVFLARHGRMADCITGRVRRLRISCETEVPYQLDGDPGGFLPVEVEALPGRLTLVVPAATAERFRRQTNT